MIANYDDSGKSVRLWKEVLKSRGYIESSYMSGLSATEMHAQLMTARHALLTATQRTKDSGHLQRELDKAIQRQVIQYDFSVRSPEGEIFELICGQYGFSPDRLFPYNLDSALLSKQNAIRTFSDATLRKSTMVAELWRLEQQCNVSSSSSSTGCITSFDQLCDVLESEAHLILSLITNVRNRRNVLTEAAIPESVNTFIVYLPVRLNSILHSASYANNGASHSGGTCKYDDTVEERLPHQNISNPPPPPLLCASYVIRSTRALIEKIYSYYPYQHPRYYELECALVTALCSKRVIICMGLSRNTFDRVIQDILDEVVSSFAVPGEAIGNRAAQYLGSFETKQQLDKSRTTGAQRLPGQAHLITLQELLYLKNDPEAHTMEIYTKPYTDVRCFLSENERTGIEHAAACLQMSSQHEVDYGIGIVQKQEECVDHAFAQYIAQDLVACSVEDICTNYWMYIAEDGIEPTSAQIKDEFEVTNDMNFESPQEKHTSRSDYNERVFSQQQRIFSSMGSPAKCACISSTEDAAMHCMDTHMHFMRFELNNHQMQTMGTDVLDVMQCVAQSLRAHMFRVTGQMQTCGYPHDSHTTTSFGVACVNPDQSHGLMVWSESKKRKPPHVLFSMWVSPVTNDCKDVRTLHICVNATYPLRNGAEAANASMNDTNITRGELRAFVQQNIFHVRIKGVSHIRAAFVHPRNIQIYNSVTMETQYKRVFPILTSGTNLAEVLMHPFVDARYTTSSNPREIENSFGIAAAEIFILRQMVRIFPAIRHEIFFRQVTKFMTHRGTLMDVRCTTFNKHYQPKRNTGAGFLHLQTSEQPVAAIFDAAFHNAIDPLVGASESLLTSNLAPIGTGFVDVAIHHVKQSKQADGNQTIDRVKHMAVVLDLTQQDIQEFVGCVDHDEMVTQTISRSLVSDALNANPEIQEKQDSAEIHSQLGVLSTVAAAAAAASGSSSSAAVPHPTQTALNQYIADYQERCARYKRKCQDWMFQEKAQEDMQQRAMQASLVPIVDVSRQKQTVIGKQKRFKPAATAAAVAVPSATSNNTHPTK